MSDFLSKGIIGEREREGRRGEGKDHERTDGRGIYHMDINQREYEDYK